MFRQSHGLIRYFISLLVMIGAVVAGALVWRAFFTSPWTRDGQVLAYVVNQAPEVSGRIVKLDVQDNQVVHRGDVLYEIDPTDYEVNLANAQANVSMRAHDLQNKQAESTRRAELTTLSTSIEEKQTYSTSAAMAVANYAAAMAQLSQAKVNLERTRLRSPVNGYVTNLQLHEGDYATTGMRNLSMVDSDSFWIVGYFEETKLARIHVGDHAVAALMGFRDPVLGHVESIATGINTPNIQPGTLGLASVDPVFTWVRLAQRIPVRIHIDSVPKTVMIAVGMTATVSIGPESGAASTEGLVSRLFTQVGD